MKSAGLSARALPSVNRPRRGLFPRLFVCAAVIDGGGFVRRGVLVLQLVERQRR